MRKILVAILIILFPLIFSIGYSKEIHVAVIGKSVHPYWQK